MNPSNRNRIQDAAADTSADPLLIYIVLALLTVLGVLQIDIHRDALLRLGLDMSHEQIDTRFFGP
ncbi:MAG: hypothetical protein J0I54_22165 [Bosea sp.]|uniref:hypothetical protein n=1 Tax=unclassified Bosea (in: a-proteobacteria) TaxID=2653178 RepID=UPI0009684966|nr:MULTISPECIES: hypothetical protein [unclassified Bosea (in: a-proteobacteria)]MBN9459343.1 hypothetical protein [Bosea sp. (in: a-proteobacteria)]OJV05464.1 MAG: hypothetical protein BGO20_10575 [Bosea sp. 67-29]